MVERGEDFGSALIAVTMLVFIAASGVMVAMIVSWNRVSPASSYLVKVSGISERAVRVGPSNVLISFGS